MNANVDLTDVVIEKSGFRFVKENIRITRNGDEHTSMYYVLDIPAKIK
ncbi:MAG: hypothetical protein IJA10_04130 [Lachnospiraceae bacterium]|nr:hypothetical protein [Lachnospiraceae bacterium]